MEGFAIGWAAAWNKVRGEVQDEVVNEGADKGRVEDVGEGAARERRVRERDEVMAAANNRHCSQ